MQKKTFSFEVASQAVQNPESKVNGDSLLAVIPQDAQVMDRQGALFVVADGWVFSVTNQLTVDTIEATYYQESNRTIAEALIQAFQQAGKRLNQRMFDLDLELEGSSTCTAVVLYGDTLYGAHIGQSRAYLVRQRQVSLLTQDHIRLPQGMPQQERRRNPCYSVIYRDLCVSTQPDNIAVDIFSKLVQNGDYLVLCTDGL